MHTVVWKSREKNVAVYPPLPEEDAPWPVPWDEMLPSCTHPRLVNAVGMENSQDLPPYIQSGRAGASAAGHVVLGCPGSWSSQGVVM